MKNLIKVLVVLLMGSTVYAGAFEGNGGDIVTCLNSSGEIESRKLLDYYELENQEDGALDLGEDGMSATEKVHYVLDRLEVTSSHRAAKYRVELEEFLDRTIFVDGEIPEMDDEGELDLPSNCILQQVAIQFSGKNQPRKKYLIHKAGWDTMDENSRAGLILHEIIFGEVANSVSGKDLGSINVRALNKLISSEEAEDFKQKDMILFYRVHRYELASYKGYEVVLNWGGVNFYEGTDILITAYLYMLQSQKTKVGPLEFLCKSKFCYAKVVFAKDGIFREYDNRTPKGIVSIVNTIKLGNIEINPDYKVVTFREDGKTLFGLGLFGHKYKGYLNIETEKGDVLCVRGARKLKNGAIIKSGYIYFNEKGQVDSFESGHTYIDVGQDKCAGQVQPLKN